MRTHAVSLLVLGALVCSTGCTSSAMRRASAGTVSAPEPARAQVIFMRPSSVGGAIQSSVFDLDPAGDRFVGIVSSGTKVAYLATPGEHLFMVVGENADFMHATLAAGKTYYALVTPRMGWWKARFSLRPVHRDDPKLTKWERATTLFENTAASEQWAREHAASIQAKRTGYLRKWESKSESARAEGALRVEDGL